jgi:hypothetical protein
MAKQLDCRTSIDITQNNGICGINFGSHTTFSSHSPSASTQIPGFINISDMDSTTSKLNNSNVQMHFKRLSLNSISYFAMIVGLTISYKFSEHYITGIYSTVSTSF